MRPAEFPLAPDRVLRVLVVDDDHASRRLTGELLREASLLPLEVAFAADRCEALAQRDGVDVALVDVRLGGDDGVDVAAELVGEAGGPVVILLTAHADAQVEVAAARVGVADLLAKGSTDSAELGRAIRYALRRRADAEQLEQLAARYEVLVRNLPDAGVITCDRNFAVLACEGELYRTLLTAVDGLAGRDLREVLAELGLQAHAACYARAIAGQASEHVERLPDGRSFLLRFGPLRHGDDAATIGAVSVAVDVTAQRRAELEREEAAAALVEERERFRVAFESAATGFAITGPDGRLVEVNDTFAAMLGRDRDALRGVSIAEITGPHDRGCPLKCVQPG